MLSPTELRHCPQCLASYAIQLPKNTDNHIYEDQEEIMHNMHPKQNDPKEEKNQNMKTVNRKKTN